MILPFPLLKGVEGKKTDDEEELQFYDISQLGSKLFTALNSCFSLRDPPRAARSLRSIVPVYEVGSYLASKCYSLEDLKRIDSSVFTLAADVEELLRSTYPSGFGFVVCRLKPNLVGEEYEPFAYSHYIDGNELFVPTKHFHKHEESHKKPALTLLLKGLQDLLGQENLFKVVHLHLTISMAEKVQSSPFLEVQEQGRIVLLSQWKFFQPVHHFLEPLEEQ
jgi:hypothetical protein